MTGCGKQEMIRCEYTNEAAGFTLSIDRPVEWTAKLQEGKAEKDFGNQYEIEQKDILPSGSLQTLQDRLQSN